MIWAKTILMAGLLMMLATLFQRFSLVAQAEPVPMAPRQIEFSGNIVQFTIPESFSKDMPADDMIERVDLADEAVFADPKQFTLLRRWWDYRSGGLWRKDLGTLMMSILVQRKPADSEWDILNRAQFIRAIHGGLERTYAQNNRGALERGQPEFETLLPYIDNYEEFVFGGQRWLRHPLAGNTVSHTYYIPITETDYLMVDFTYMQADGVARDDYYDAVLPDVERIMNSFHISFAAGNPARAAVEDPSVVDFEEVKSMMKQNPDR